MRLTYTDGMRSLTGLPTSRQKVERLEAEMRSMEQAECPIEELFAPQLYARKMSAKAGTTIVGFEHKTKHLNVVAQGCIEVDVGGELRRYSAGDCFVSPAGTRRAGFVVEDVVWVTLHPTNETDPEKIIPTLICAERKDLLDVRMSTEQGVLCRS